MKRILFLLLLSSLFLATPCWAATRTWEGDDITNPTYWNDADNWGGTVPVAGDDVIINNAKNCFVNANTAALKSLDMTGYTGALSGTFAITIRGLTASTNVCKIVGIGTWTGILIFSPVSTTAVINFTSNANALTTMIITSGAAVSLVVLQDNLTFTAVKTCSITLTERGLDLNGKTITGNSAVNKLRITSNTLGTSTNRTITNALATSFNNVDFQDISFATAGALDLTNSQVNWIGDCGGNSATGGALTLTTADDWYWNGSGTRNFSDATYWFTATNGGGSQMGATRCPLPQDTCYFDGASIDGATTVNQNLPRIPTVDTTGASTFTFGETVGNYDFYGSLKISANVTFQGGNHAQRFHGRSAYLLELAGTISAFNVSVDAVGGSITLTSNATFGGTLNLNYGTLDADIYNVTCTMFTSDNSYIRTLLMGSGTWTENYATAASTNLWDMGNITNLTNPTTMGETSTILFGASDNDAVVRTFEGGGCTYNNLTVVGGGTAVHAFTGSNTFNTFTINAPKTVKFTNGTDTTVSSFVATGDAVNGITFTGTSTAGYKLSDTSGTNTVHYCTIDYATCEGGALWIATDNCVDGGHNSASGGDGSTGWLFTTGGANTSNFFMLF